MARSSGGQADAGPGLEVGARLRAARQQRAIGVRELAKRVGVSASLISQVETSKTWPSVGTLYAIVLELGLSLDDLFAANGNAGQRTPAAAAPVVPLHRAPEIRLGSGVVWRQLSPNSEPGIDFLEIIYPPGSESSPPHRRIQHHGREYGLVLSGMLRTSVGEKRYDLHAGDSISFDSRQLHRLHNPGTVPALAVWLIVDRHAHDAR